MCITAAQKETSTYEYGRGPNECSLAETPTTPTTEVAMRALMEWHQPTQARRVKPDVTRLRVAHALCAETQYTSAVTLPLSKEMSRSPPSTKEPPQRNRLQQ